MLKKFADKKTKTILVLLQQCLAIAMIVIVVTLMTSMCFATSDGSRDMVYVDFLDQTESFQDSDTFRDLFLSDVHKLSHYLAVCEQVETNGTFDKNKTIDLLQYVNRRDANAKDITSSGRLEYRIGDLINWYEVDGIGYTVSDDSEGGEVIAEDYLPTDRISIYEKSLYKILLKAGIVDEECNEITDDVHDTTIGYDGDSDYDYEASEVTVEQGTVDLDVVISAGENLIMEDAGEEDKLGVFYEEKARIIVSNYIAQAACDLSANYRAYSSEQNYFGKDGNFKYLYVPVGNKKTVYTNCNGTSRKELIANFVSCMETGNGSYIKYNFGIDEITTKNFDENDKNHTELQKRIRDYKYAFQDKGTLYIAYINSNEEAMLLGGIEKEGNEDVYVKTAAVYEDIKPNFPSYIIALIVCAILFVLCFLVWSCLVGLCQEVTEEDGVEKRYVRSVRAGELCGFDKWYTAIAAVFACAVETGLFLAAILLIEVYIANKWLVFTDEEMMAACIILGILLVAGLQFFWASFVRRARAHTLFKNGVIYHLFLLVKRIFVFLKNSIIGKIKKVFGRLQIVMADKNLLLRLWLPYMIFLVLNMLLIGIGYAFTWNFFAGCVLAFLFDIVVGILMTKNAKERESILEGIGRIADGEITFQLETSAFHGENVLFAEAVNRIGDGIHEAVQISMKDERLKADLITNVSHDIKTPLTSIINYVDLLKRIDIQDEKAKGYLQILDEKSQRLKQLTLDLVEASKISSGNIVLHMESIKVNDLMMQVVGEFSDKFQEKNLTMIADFPEETVMIQADSRRMWRVMENLFNNIYKYAMPGTRVYLNVVQKEKVWITLKNISAQELNINADELTERFIRGDVSRSTEGSGLGLSIAQNLVTAQNGTFQIILDGDLFKVLISFELDGKN